MNVFSPQSGDGIRLKYGLADKFILLGVATAWGLSLIHIYSHVGMIISDEATSHEIIENSGSGIVYHYNDIDSFKKHIEDVIRNLSLIHI